MLEHMGYTKVLPGLASLSRMHEPAECMNLRVHVGERHIDIREELGTMNDSQSSNRYQISFAMCVGCVVIPRLMGRAPQVFDKESKEQEGF